MERGSGEWREVVESGEWREGVESGENYQNVGN